MCHSLKVSKQLVKSLLSAGNGWTHRIANNPHGELLVRSFFFFFVSAFFKHRTNTLEKHKVNNMKVNRKKNERLRKATEKSMELPDEDTKMPLGKN